ncbi:MAG: hypothetical protein KIT02_16090 [Devosia sp.]|uniref:hypothetical protein n=1 Tax=Devosia sp. TaxID=1871048 RepID=UPI0024CC89C9|nr:hypothetical protein [Devosia sp.]UYN99409.1 MAG: hypothetical protein KIT02_16090 [Devosia sp.]
MVFDTLKDRMGGTDMLEPMRIANHPLFTAQEKLDLLNQLKAEVTSVGQEGLEVGFEPEAIEEAIAQVRAGVADGVGSQTVFKGDF